MDKEIIKHKLVFNGDDFDPLALVAVHVSAYQPKLNACGEVELLSRSSGSNFKEFRNTIHVALNHLVVPHSEASWEEGNPYVVISNFAEICEKNGMPKCFNTVDTWWSRGAKEKLILPDAHIIEPDIGNELPDGKLFKIDAKKQITTYKASGFKAEDIHSILQSNSSYPLHDIFISMLRQKIEKQLSEHNITLENLNNDNLRTIGVSSIHKIEATLAGYLKRLATDETINSLGYELQEGGAYAWEYSTQSRVTNASAEFRSTNKVPYARHFKSEYAELEQTLQPLSFLENDMKEGKISADDAKSNATDCIRKAQSVLSKYDFDDGTKEVAALTIAAASKTFGIHSFTNGILSQSAKQDKIRFHH